MSSSLVFTNIYKKPIINTNNLNEIPTAKTFLKLFGTPDLTTNSTISFPPQYFSGIQIKNLYNVPTVVANSKKVTIAVIVAYTYPNLKEDLKIYWQNPINFGPSSNPPNINIYTMNGATTDIGWAQEECLDVQMVCTINPNANIWVVEAKSSRLSDLIIALNYANSTIKADVISMSWGLDEVSQLNPYNNYFTNTSICYCAASGDYNIVSWPATSSNCIAVGGTSLIWSPNNSPQRTEYPWNSAGCGYSKIIAQPNYQYDINSITHKNRVIPDLSLIGDVNTSAYTVYNGNWYGVGGTSVGTPIFAGILSLANQLRFNAGKSALTTVYNTSPNSTTNSIYKAPINHVQTYLYKTIYTNQNNYTRAFYDIISGSNIGSIGGNSNGTTTYNADAKFDITTGLGSPNATYLCNSLLNI